MTDAIVTSSTASSFVYVTYIRTTAEKLWAALTDTDFHAQYWFGTRFETTWEKGAPWRMISADGTLTDSGEVLAIEKLRRVVLKWKNEFRPELSAEGYATCTYEIEQTDGAMKLTITHAIDVSHAKLITAVSGGWPRILSNLKSLLETGEVALKSKP